MEAPQTLTPAPSWKRSGRSKRSNLRYFQRRGRVRIHRRVVAADTSEEKGVRAGEFEAEHLNESGLSELCNVRLTPEPGFPFSRWETLWDRC